MDWDLIAASQVVSDGERRWADAAFAFLNEEISDPNYWPSEERGFWEGPQNFTSDHYSCVAAVACLLDRHPRRDEWLVWAQDRLNAEFVRWSYPGGAWEEAPNYQCATMLYLVPMIRMLRLNGYTGFRGAELFKATMRFLGDMQTPYDPRRKTAMLPTVGDTTFSFHSQSLQDLFAWAAHDYSEDAEFAARMMWHWRQGGALMCGVHDGGMIMGQWASALMMVDPAIAPAEPPAAVSRRMDGYGVKLCQKNADGEETYLLIKCGPAKSHYHPDELSFHYYGRGTPLALDYGSMYVPRVNQPWYHNRISIDHKMDAARGNIADFVVLEAADYFAGEVVIDSVTEVPELPDAPYTRAYEKPCGEHPTGRVDPPDYAQPRRRVFCRLGHDCQRFAQRLVAARASDGYRIGSEQMALPRSAWHRLGGILGRTAERESGNGRLESRQQPQSDQHGNPRFAALHVEPAR